MKCLSLFNCFVILFLISFLSCNNHKENTGDLPQIKLCLTKDLLKNVYASEFISNIEYIPLETSEQSLIKFTDMDISDNYILVKGEPYMLFSRQGKFIRHIGSVGQGPGEYSSVSDFYIYEKSSMIYLSNDYEIFAFRISGEFFKKLDLREFCKKLGIPKLWKIVHWKDDIFCANIDLNSGKELYTFVVFTLDGEVVKLFPNYMTFDKEIRFHSNYAFAEIYKHNGLVSNKRAISDTIFRLTDQLEMVPDVYFDLCGRSPSKMPISSIFDSYTSISFINEVGNYILFGCSFGNITPSDLPSMQFCIYDRNSTNLIFCKGDPFSRKPPRVLPNGELLQRNSASDYYSGFINDIDGGLPFWTDLIRLQNKQQLAMTYQPSVMLGNLTEEYFSAHEIKDIQAHERLKKLLENLEEDDNPVLMIATFK